MNGGLQKLVEAQESVAQLSKELAVKEKDLDVANKEAEEVLRTVSQMFYCHILSANIITFLSVGFTFFVNKVIIRRRLN